MQHSGSPIIGTERINLLIVTCWLWTNYSIFSVMELIHMYAQWFALLKVLNPPIRKQLQGENPRSRVECSWWRPIILCLVGYWFLSTGFFFPLPLAQLIWNKLHNICVRCKIFLKWRVKESYFSCSRNTLMAQLVPNWIKFFVSIFINVELDER